MSSFYPSFYYSNNLAGSQSSAREIVPIVMEMLQPSRVIDVGCGTGAWLKVFQDFGVKKILGVDANQTNSLEISPEEFINVDLNKPLFIQGKFDLAVCLEVAEHLSKDSAKQLVTSLTELSPVILFSAAIPFQGGFRHLNEQWPEYWQKLFKEKNYVVVDAIRKKIWNNPTVSWWYSQNIFFYVKEDVLANYPLLKSERELTNENQLSLIHPKSFNIVRIGKILPRLFFAAVKKKLNL